MMKHQVLITKNKKCSGNHKEISALPFETDKVTVVSEISYNNSVPRKQILFHWYTASRSIELLVRVELILS